MRVETLVVGAVEIVAIRDVDTLMPLEEAFMPSDAPPPDQVETLGERYPDDFTADSWRFRDHCFLVRTPAALALIDTGVGPIDAAFGRWLGVGGSLPEQLAEIGVVPGDVDHIVLTHIHSDHIGWNTESADAGFVPRFPNARYHLHRADVDWKQSFDDPDDIREFAEVIAPLVASGQLDTSEEDRDVLPGLGFRHAPGHTPGHRVVLLEAGGERVLFAGDLIHFTFQLNEVTYTRHSDMDPAEAARARHTWLDRVEAEGMTFASAHLPPSPIGTLVREDGLRRLSPG